MTQNTKQQKQKDAIDAWRRLRKCITLRPTESEYKKIMALCCDLSGEKNKNRKNGATMSSIIIALAKGEHIPSKIDKYAFSLFLMHIGLHKHTKNTFLSHQEIKLDINETIALLYKGQQIIHEAKTERKINKIKNESAPRTYKRIGIYFKNDELEEVKKRAGGMPVASYIYQLLKNKELTSRFTLDDIEQLHQVGSAIKIAIDAELARQENAPDATPSLDIVDAVQCYKNSLNQILARQKSRGSE